MSGRPLGEIRAALRMQLTREPLSVRDLAGRLQVPVRVAGYTLAREVAAGTVRPVAPAAAAGRGRPAALYATADAEPPAPPADALQSVWPGIVVLDWD